jgi:ubiquinone/menaquinone biosynthesis C-methylase UbiE
MILENKNDTPELYADLYAKYRIEGTPYLAFRDLPQIIKQFVIGKKTIDYGSGGGESAIFLKSLGLDVVGMDINPQMIAKSRVRDPLGKYIKITSGCISEANNTYDFVFAGFVLLEIGKKDEMLAVVKDISRVLKKGGVFITVVANENTYNHDWLTINTDFEENKSPVSGSRVKIQFRDIDLTIFDYYWSEKDYIEVLGKAGLEVVKVHKPLGLAGDRYEWRDEKIAAPSSVLISRKS